MLLSESCVAIVSLGGGGCSCPPHSDPSLLASISSSSLRRSTQGPSNRRHSQTTRRGYHAFPAAPRCYVLPTQP
ncbi:hypothetical protein PR002_g25457 [Phytophthora rubi]|uniref:Uncharacterized protein n=1 Tax=Phytophthora rubi TaxID=129364 RepID=A0A6A3I7H1_9STRA|nr:hypothetical protein PR002_g25457 [Phytophthora rubi]